MIGGFPELVLSNDDEYAQRMLREDVVDKVIKRDVLTFLIYRANPIDVGSKGPLKGRPKIFIADAAIKNAVLMIDDVLADVKENQKEVDVVIELPREKILCDVKYRNDSSIPSLDAIVTLTSDYYLLTISANKT